MENGFHLTTPCISQSIIDLLNKNSIGELAKKIGQLKWCEMKWKIAVRPLKLALVLHWVGVTAVNISPMPNIEFALR